LDTNVVISREVVVAQGRFAPGHLGELTQLVAFEMVDEVLAAAGRTQVRVRDLPSRVVVYLLLAAGLFAEVGYRQVWARMVAGLDGLVVAMPGSSALTQARRRIGVAPLRALFNLLAGPAAGAARWRGLLVCAVDGTTMSVPDNAANLAPLPAPERVSWRVRVSADAAARSSGLRHPHRHRRGVRADQHRRDQLRATSARMPTARHAVAGRPQLRRA
jgi:hypothetical protein